ncbi:DMT family transporter [Pseudomonas vancouverensis]|uniref:DMT family transporter n=1 Tax=Pseudomonas vancouverensis TaxID=95300 RepID=A0A1H2PBL5_PSEVA|nr:DMT family transporter [Pseudomonas vancouverensis]KAB0491869.1 DMT family transporter [Pseudomonas vancouverensis]TDB61990.1 DMT family transporter [Pseudomonas vancouverensis]SDV14715.1 Permease of the drug/metabolite transporter (DMT) superfamily [Pseudomonas vancouverensis]
MQYAYPLLAIFIWAGNTVITKMSAGAIFPAEIGFYRWLLAGLLFTPFMFKPVVAHWSLIRPNLGKIFVLGVLGMAVYQSLAYFAAGMTTATNMGIILSLMPLMSLTMAIISLGQRLTMGALAGAVLSFAGVLVVVSSGSLGALVEHGVNLGDVMMLIATLAYAIYSTLLKKWQLKLPPLVLLYLQVLVAVVVLFPLYFVSQKVGPTLQNIPLVLYACLLASMVAPLAWMQAVVRLGPSRTTQFFNLLPLITALIAAVVLHEQLRMYHLIGGVLTLGGVILSERWTTVFGRRASVA